MSGERLEPGSPDSSEAKPGEVLARARDEAGISQREVSDALHLPVSTVAAIESGDRTELPADVFTRGYIRAYAKLLELDPEPLVAALKDDQQVDDGIHPSEQSNTHSVAGSSMNGVDLAVLKKPSVVLGALTVIAVGILSWVLSGNGDVDGEVPSNEPTVAVNNTETGASEVEPQLAAPAQEIPNQRSSVAEPGIASSQLPSEQIQAQEPEQEPVLEPETVTMAEPLVSEIEAANDTVGTSPLAEQLAAESNEVAATVAAAVISAEPKRLTPEGDDRLSIEFTEECWVEIKDASGAALFGDLGQAGQRIELIGAAPFRVLLGYAPGVLLTYNAEPVALTAHTRNNVASLVLGQ